MLCRACRGAYRGVTCRRGGGLGAGGGGYLKYVYSVYAVWEDAK